MRIETAIHARAGLLGNPSDGYFGKTLSCLIGNFAATVTLEESPQLVLLPHQRFDPTTFGSINELADTYGEQGYYGGLRLLQAACTRFATVCREREIPLVGPNFTLSYTTDIPRQVGMSGSSAIIIAVLRSLLKWYGVENRFVRERFPGLALEIETAELGITAGLQDRVIQTYGGAVYMDFARELVEGRGYGEYTPIDPAILPPLFVAYVLDPSDSGAIHSDVRRRWLDGDPEVRAAMGTFASFAADGVAALRAGDHATIAALMGDAFALRRRIFGDAVLGPDNLRMVELAHKHGFRATTCGSGGGVVGVLADEERGAAFAADLAREGYQFVRLHVGPAYPWAS